MKASLKRAFTFSRNNSNIPGIYTMYISFLNNHQHKLVFLVKFIECFWSGLAIPCNCIASQGFWKALSISVIFPFIIQNIEESKLYLYAKNVIFKQNWTRLLWKVIERTKCSSDQARCCIPTALSPCRPGGRGPNLYKGFHIINKMTWETSELCSEKRKPGGEREEMKQKHQKKHYK